MKIIMLHNEKGGVGKTTLATHIAAGLAILGNRVVLIDADPQAHAAISLGISPRPALHDMLVRKATFKDVLEFVPPQVYAPDGKSQGQFFVLPGDVETRVIPMLVPDVWLLRRRLSQMNGVDYVIVDTSPSPSLLHSMIYVATDAILYPTTCERLSFDGLVQSMAHTDEADIGRRPQLEAIERLGIVPMMFRAKTVEHSENLKVLKEHYPEMVWKPLPQRITWAEASGLSQTVFAVGPHTSAANEAWAIVNRIVA